MSTLGAPLLLRPPGPDDETAARAAHETLSEEGFAFLLELEPGMSWARYLQKLAAVRCGTGLAPDRVPATFLVAEVDGRIVGRSSIRHELTEWLRARGGHIGYGVLPEYRRRGYATEILRQSLIVARSHGVRDTLLTVDEDNVASTRVVERCGGRPDPAWPSDVLDGTPIRRFWIAVT